VTKTFPARTGDVVHSLIPETHNSFHQTAIFFKKCGSDKAAKNMAILVWEAQTLRAKTYQFLYVAWLTGYKDSENIYRNIFYH